MSGGAQCDGEESIDGRWWVCLSIERDVEELPKGQLYIYSELPDFDKVEEAMFVSLRG